MLVARSLLFGAVLLSGLGLGYGTWAHVSNPAASNCCGCPLCPSNCEPCAAGGCAVCPHCDDCCAAGNDCCDACSQK
jgi:hypothetical protein